MRWWIALLISGPAWAAPEGTPELGLTQGLEDVSLVRVELRPGEALRICSSDDGLQEANVDGAAIDRMPGQPNPVAAARRGAEILVWAPDASRCGGDADCSAGTRCFLQRTGEVYVGAEQSGQCAQTLAVTPQTGFCAANTPPRWHRLTGAAGIWNIDFAGEPETLSRSGTSTRFFLIDVDGANGQPAPRGRVHARQWLLNAHSFASGSSARFHVPVSVADLGSQVFTLRLGDLRGFRYALAANDHGLNDLRDLSWCQFGDPVDGQCPFYDGGPVRQGNTRYPLYLNPPDPLPPPPPPAALGEVRFEDAAGTPSLSPNGDGIQDTGHFSFESQVPGVWRVVIDTDQDGTFDASRDRAFVGDTAGNEPVEVEWDGLGPNGRALPAGDYPFEVSVTVAEVHFPMFDIEDNTAGFLVDRLGPGGPTPAPLFWNDTAIRGADVLVDATDAIEVLPEGSAMRRRWRQPSAPNEAGESTDIPLAFDTWAYAGRAVATEAVCRLCPQPARAITLGEDEVGDSDGDGLLDDAEDRNGNGMVDADETDPHNPDTDGDGLADGLEVQTGTDPIRVDSDGDGLPDNIEDTNLDGQRSADETDPRDPDTDGDGALDGAEDADGDGQRDPNESDPLNPDSDRDGVLDGRDPAPNDPNVPVEGAGPQDAMVDAAVADAGPEPDASTALPPVNGGGCRQTPTAPLPWPFLGLGLALALRRRRR